MGDTQTLPVPSPEMTALLERAIRRAAEEGLTLPEYFTPKEAAAYLKLDPVTLAVWRRKGRGPQFRIGKDSKRTILYRRADCDAWLIEEGRR